MSKNEKIIALSKFENTGMAIAVIREHLELHTTKNQLLTFLNEQDVSVPFDKLVERVMETKRWQDIIDEFYIDWVRVCSHCGSPMIVGVISDYEYYCSDECIDKAIGIEKYNERAEFADDEDADTYYTEWTSPNQLQPLAERYYKTYMEQGLKNI